MKKSLLFISALCLSATGFAQLDSIANANLDYWTGTEPNGWGTLNAAGGALTAGSAAQATGADILGTNTIVLTTKMVAGAPNGGIVPGTAVSNGTVGLAGISGGFPYRQHPLSLKGVAKYAGVGADAPAIAVVLTKWVPADSAASPIVPAHRDTIGGGFTVTSPVGAAYGTFEVLIDYSPSAGAAIAPDTAMIVLASSGLTGGVVGSQLFVDSLRFDLGCTLDPAIVSSGGVATQTPPASDTLKLTAGATYTKTWTLFIPRDVTNPAAATLDSVLLDETSFSSVGLGTTDSYTVTSNWPGGMFGVNSIGCITVSGVVPATPTDAMGSVTINPWLYGTIAGLGGPVSHMQSPLNNNTTNVQIGKGNITDIADFDISGGFNVSGNYPNPFDNSTTINFNTEVNGSVSFVVVDVLGRQVYDTNITATAGSNTFTYTTDLASGTYFFSLSDGTNTVTKKIVVSK